MCGCNLVTPRLIGGGGRSSAGSLSMFAAIRRAPSWVSRLGLQNADRALPRNKNSRAPERPHTASSSSSCYPLGLASHPRPKACRVSAFPPCGRLMLPVPIFGVGLPYGWASWPTWPRIDVRGRLFGGLRPLPILGYRGAVRPPMCVLVVGTVCNLGPACPGFFFISATRETEPPQRPRLSQRGAMWPRVGGCAWHLTG